MVGEIQYYNNWNVHSMIKSSVTFATGRESVVLGPNWVTGATTGLPLSFSSSSSSSSKTDETGKQQQKQNR